MKFYVGSKQAGTYFKNEIRKTFAKNSGFVSVSEVKDIFREASNKDDSYIGWDIDSDIGKKMRVRECKDGWYLYLPEPNAVIRIGEDKDVDRPSLIGDVCVFETEIFEELVKTIDEGFFGLMQALVCNSGRLYRPCIVKAKKSGRKEERQDRKAKFHRWADLSKGVQQVVAIVEFEDGHIEQVQPDRVIFKEVEENA